MKLEEPGVGAAAGGPLLERSSRQQRLGGADGPRRRLIGVDVNPDVDASIQRSERWPEETKEFLALMFFKGALLNDSESVLEEQGPNSRSARRIRFSSVEDVSRLIDTVKSYVDEAIEVEEAGLEVGPAPELGPVGELQHRLDQDPEFEAAFDALTPGRQREYNLYFSDAKRASTREARVQKHAQKILDGKGLRDR